MNVKQIVEQHLKANGFDGLYNDNECGCVLVDPVPVRGVASRIPKAERYARVCEKCGADTGSIHAHSRYCKPCGIKVRRDRHRLWERHNYRKCGPRIRDGFVPETAEKELPVDAVEYLLVAGALSTLTAGELARAGYGHDKLGLLMVELPDYLYPLRPPIGYVRRFVV